MSRIRAPRRAGLLPLLPLLLPLLFLAPDRSGAYTPSVHGDGSVPVWDLRSFAANVQNDRVSWHTHPAGTADELDNAWGIDEFEAIRRSFATWENVETSFLRFWEDQIRTAQRHNVQDRVNLMQFVKEDLDPFVLGVTYPYEEDGMLVDCDIQLNDDFDWSTSNPGRSNRPDVQSVMTHEIGHLLGLDHAPLGQSTMFYSYTPGAISTRSLAPDDIAGITSLYPTFDVDLEYGRIAGRVDVDGTTNERGIQVVALDVGTSEPFSGTLTRPDGTYEFLVKPGFYRLIATPARPSSSLNPYWKSGDDRVLPRALTAEGTAIGTAVVVRVDAGATTVVGDIDVERVDSPLENDNRADRATPIRVGDMVAARFESARNEDWFSFEASGGDIVTITVHAAQIGSNGNPELKLLDTDAEKTLARSLDIRASLFAVNKHGEAGLDVDCRIESYELPRDGRYFLRVRPAAHGETGGRGDYYALLVASGRNAPARQTTEVTVLPDRLKADGIGNALITVIPKTILDERIGAGLFVDIIHDGVATLGPVSDLGDGTYTAVLTAPTTSGEDRIDVRVRGGGGSVDLEDVRRVVYVGPPNGAATTLHTTPSRLPADGASTTTITVFPRDIRGEIVGTDVDVTLEFVGAPAGSLGAVLGHFDGSYSAILRAANTPREVRIRAIMNGTVVSKPVRVAFGFELDSVTRDLLIQVADLAADESLPSSACKKLDPALGKLRRADGYLRDPRLLVPDVKRAAKDIYKALKSIVKARRKADDDTLAPVAEDLLEALRRIVDTEAPPAGSARDRYAEGVAATAAGDLHRAAKHYYKAYKIAVGDREPSRVRAAEVVLERDDDGLTLVVRMASGKVRRAGLVGAEDVKLKSDGTQDGFRIYAAEIDGVVVGGFDLVVEPKGDGTASTTPFVVDGDAPPTAAILAPAANTTGVSATPTIRWTAVPGAATYGLLVIRSGDRIAFAQTVLAGGTTELTLSEAFALSPGKKYTLEIRTVAQDGDRSIARVTFRVGG